MRLTASVWKEEDMFVARCVELRVTSQGKTKEEALANLKEAVELYLEDEDERDIPRPEIHEIEIRS